MSTEPVKKYWRLSEKTSHSILLSSPHNSFKSLFNELSIKYNFNISLVFKRLCMSYEDSSFLLCHKTIEALIFCITTYSCLLYIRNYINLFFIYFLEK